MVYEDLLIIDVPPSVPHCLALENPRNHFNKKIKWQMHNIMPCVSLLVSYQVVKAELRIEESMMMTQTAMDSDLYMSTLLSR